MQNPREPAKLDRMPGRRLGSSSRATALVEPEETPIVAARELLRAVSVSELKFSMCATPVRPVRIAFFQERHGFLSTANIKVDTALRVIGKRYPQAPSA